MQLRCGDRRLVVPRSAVVEIKAYSPPEPLLSPNGQKPIAGPNWILGSTQHRDQHLPLLALEQLIDQEQPSPQQARICVLQILDSSLPLKGYAVLCQGFPSLLEVPAVIDSKLGQQNAADDPDVNNEFIASQIQLDGYYCAVPNLPAIEQRLAQTLSVAN